MPHAPGERTYNFVDLTDDIIAGMTVVRQTTSSDRGAGTRWVVRHVKCGHEEIVLGGQLREMKRKPPHKPRRCRVCFPKGWRAGDPQP